MIRFYLYNVILGAFTSYQYGFSVVHRGYQNDTRGIALARDTVIWRSSIVQHPFWFFCTKLRLLHVCFVQQPLSYHKIFLPHKGIDGNIAEDREWLCPDADNEGKGDGNDAHGSC